MFGHGYAIGQEDSYDAAEWRLPPRDIMRRQGGEVYRDERDFESYQPAHVDDKHQDAYGNEDNAVPYAVNAYPVFGGLDYRPGHPGYDSFENYGPYDRSYASGVGEHDISLHMRRARPWPPPTYYPGGPMGYWGEYPSAATARHGIPPYTSRPPWGGDRGPYLGAYDAPHRHPQDIPYHGSDDQRENCLMDPATRIQSRPSPDKFASIRPPTASTATQKTSQSPSARHVESRGAANYRPYSDSQDDLMHDLKGGFGVQISERYAHGPHVRHPQQLQQHCEEVGIENTPSSSRTTLAETLDSQRSSEIGYHVKPIGTTPVKQLKKYRESDKPHEADSEEIEPEKTDPYVGRTPDPSPVARSTRPRRRMPTAGTLSRLTHSQSTRTLNHARSQPNLRQAQDTRSRVNDVDSLATRVPRAETNKPIRGRKPSHYEVGRSEDFLPRPATASGANVDADGSKSSWIVMSQSPSELPHGPDRPKQYNAWSPAKQSQLSLPLHQQVAPSSPGSDSQSLERQLDELLSRPQQALNQVTKLHSASRSNQPVSPHLLQHLLQLIKDNPKDQESALHLAKSLLEAADVLVLGYDQKTRDKARKDYHARAHKLLKNLCKARNTEAMFVLADCLGLGVLGKKPNKKEAFALYHSAAKLGHVLSAYQAGICCELGHEEGGGTRKDAAKAMGWYKRAAALGEAQAMYKIAMIYLHGLLGQSPSPRDGVIWLKRAAADGKNPRALHELGLLHESARHNDILIRDNNHALGLFRQAALLGFRESQYKLGRVFEYGLMDRAIDPPQSISWYFQAAAQEDHQSELALGCWYLTGSDKTLDQSDTKAYQWVKKAAVAGFRPAEYALGCFTELGISVPGSAADAKHWYSRAAAKHCPKARERLEALQRHDVRQLYTRRQITRSFVMQQRDSECNIM